MPVNNAQAVGGGNDAMQGIMQLLQLAGGLTSSTQKSTADTSAIDAVLKQLQGQDFSGILNSVFQQASAKTPQLTTQLANAVGARTGNNSPLATALQQVLQAATVQGQGQIAQQQAQNLQTQAALAGQKAQATRTVQTKENTASNGAKQLLAGLQLGNTASKMYNKKSLYDNAKDLFGGGGNGSSAVAPLGGGGALRIPTVGVTPTTIGGGVPTASADALSNIQFMAGGSPANTAASSPGLDFTSWLDSGAADTSATSTLALNPDYTTNIMTSGTDYSSLGLGGSFGGLGDASSELAKNGALDNLDLSFYSDAGSSAASGASIASQGSDAGINAAAESVGGSFASELPIVGWVIQGLQDFSNRKDIYHSLGSGDTPWYDKAAAISGSYKPYVHYGGEIVNDLATNWDDNKTNPVLAVTRTTRDIEKQMNREDPAQKWNRSNGLPSMADTTMAPVNSLNNFIETFSKNPGQALSNVGENASTFVSNIDDGAHSLINGISHGVQNVANNIGDAIADVFGW